MAATLKFLAVEGAGIEQAALRVVELDRTNPFHTPEYIAARRKFGEQPIVFLLEDRESIVAGCAGFVKSGRLARELDIPSVAAVESDSPFWQGLHDWCRSRRIWDVHLNSFGARISHIPQWRGEISRVPRTEYVLDLTCDDLVAGMRKNVRWTVNKGRKTGLILHRTRETAACDAHESMVTASLVRRENRGEQAEHTSATIFHTLIETGAGELLQAHLNGEVVSSILILHAPDGSYYYSGGTSPAGMDCGASAFLLAEAALALKQENRTRFNLGGAGPDNPGLQKYKIGFGGTEVPLERASFSVMPALMQHVRKAASQIVARLG